MSSGDNTGERNPFAPPPADAPDQPWQPRNPRPGSEDQGGTEDSGGSDERPQVPPPHPWSPGYQGGWSPRPSAPQPPRLDPSDPTQRRARNAALAGVAALMCAVAGVYYVALFVGALAVLWGVSALRAPKPAAAEGDHTVSPAPSPLTTPALGGILAGAMTVVFVGSVIGLNLYYNDYVTCVRDSLTTSGEDSCDSLAPKWYTDIANKGD
ncbi:hypothetical protein ACWEQL_32800 [Kitasatospora sp. NPDC004240]